MSLHFRLEPLSPPTDFHRGLRARVADPVWFLTRQWQLGELQGEDVSSPIAVAVSVTHEPLRYAPRRPDLDPARIPAEALVEAEPGDWWTIGRRVRLGRAAAPLLPALPPQRLRTLRLGPLPPPYEAMSEELDGRAIFIAGLLAGHALWNEVPSPPADNWSSRKLTHDAHFSAGTRGLEIRDHDGGDVDWYSADAGGTVLRADAGTNGGTNAGTNGGTSASMTSSRQLLVSRLSYPGAPHPRWWQIEDGAVDLGAFSPDRSHLGTALLLDVALAHADDWFWFPVPEPPPSAGGERPPSSGMLVTLRDTVVHDSFDDTWTLAPPPVDGPQAWSLFRTTGMEAGALLIWPVAVAPHAGPWLDDVSLGIDEDANVAWAVELRADGRVLLADDTSEAAARETTRTGTRQFRYLPSNTLPAHWHPYRRTGPDGRYGDWQQGLVADLGGVLPRVRPGPASRLIGGPSGPGFGRGHEIAPEAIASSGVSLRRRARLARDTEGRPVLWVERSRTPLAGPPVSHLRFDVMAEDVVPPGDGDG
ncbi:hypothetical protein K7G19_02410 [Cupriavidus sp. DB3]|uniref:hypothetical protein n=1 Tax=Cupriavidus sp. DB3 TaxID=2873259 RepID=UPI001CF50493|nr:hypothetical protein [Cupriavidus sp. DB3]MCA7082451.1 hypothetical protein [Cupriavidus sp. DB3]